MTVPLWSSLYSPSPPFGGSPDEPPPPLPPSPSGGSSSSRRLFVVSVMSMMLLWSGCKKEEKRDPACRAVNLRAQVFEDRFFEAPEDTLYQQAFFDSIAALSLPEPPRCLAREYAWLSVVRNNTRIAVGQYQEAADSAEALLVRVAPLEKPWPDRLRARLLRHKARALLRLGRLDESASAYRLAGRYAGYLEPIEAYHLEIYGAEALEAIARRDSTSRRSREQLERARRAWDRAIEALESWEAEDEAETAYVNHLVAKALENKAAFIRRNSRYAFRVKTANGGASLTGLFYDWRAWFALALLVASHIIVTVWRSIKEQTAYLPDAGDAVVQVRPSKPPPHSKEWREATETDD